MNKTSKPESILKRLFIAIKINPDKRFMDLYSKIKIGLSAEKIRWVRPENLHITLRFLGATNPELIPLISAQLARSFVTIKPFIVDLYGLGIFRSLYNPKVLWVGLKNPGDLISTKRTMDLHLRSVIHLEETESLNMHLTIGRMKSINKRDVWEEIINAYHNLNFMEFRVEKVILFESVLEKTGPVYNELNEFLLEHAE